MGTESIVESQTEYSPVTDRYNYVYFGFYLYGLGSLMMHGLTNFRGFKAKFVR